MRKIVILAALTLGAGCATTQDAPATKTTIDPAFAHRATAYPAPPPPTQVLNTSAPYTQTSARP